MGTDSNDLRPGDRLGDFRIIETIGEGGMGVVYLARDDRLDRKVAIKAIAPQLAHDREFQKRFEAEAKSAAAIDDAHAVPIYSAGSLDGRLYIAMRYVEGTDLRAVLRDRGALDPRTSVAIATDVSAALDAAHAVGLVHRDVKPANILLEGESGKGQAYLTDFGLTKGLQSERSQLTGTGQWIGTLDYVAPEQMTSGRVDARTDIYALGCVLYEMLTGSVPFEGTDMQKMWGHVNEPVPRLAGDGGRLEAVLARATAKDPADRFPSAGDLARAALASTEGGSVSQPEHSVAAGVAATGLVEAPEDPSRTRTMRTPIPAPSDPETARMPAPAAAPPGGTGAGRSTGSPARVAAIAGASAVLAAGLIAAAIVLGRTGDHGSRTVIRKQVETVHRTAPARASSPATAPVEETSSAEAVPAVGSSLFSQSLYSVRIPSGWVQEENDEPIADYVESTWVNPADPGSKILIDAESPASGSPIASAESVRVQTEPSNGYREGGIEPTRLAGQPAARWVFDVSGDRRVDYFFYDCGVGLAVLGSTSPAAFGALAETFHGVASSIAVPCGE